LGCAADRGKWIHAFEIVLTPDFFLFGCGLKLPACRGPY
jgi:hypothetical protein